MLAWLANKMLAELDIYDYIDAQQSRYIFLKYFWDFSSLSQKDALLAYFPLYRLLLLSTLASLAIEKQEGKESGWEGSLGRGTPNERNGQKI